MFSVPRWFNGVFFELRNNNVDIKLRQLGYSLVQSISFSVVVQPIKKRVRRTFPIIFRLPLPEHLAHFEFQVTNLLDWSALLGFLNEHGRSFQALL